MDTQTQRKDDEKKKGGLWANLVGAGGARTAGGLGGLGQGAGGLAGLLGRVGLGSGILATKAGLVALIMAGTTVAGGLGWLGYRLFGPSDSDRVGAAYSLFSPRPNDAALAGAGAGGAGGDQSAQPGQGSLDQFKAANGAGSSSADGVAEGKAAADKAAADKAAADKAAADKQAADAAAQAAAKKAEGNKGNVLGNQAANKLKSDMKVGQLSKMDAGGVSAGSSAMMAKADPKANGLGAFSTSKTPGAAERAAMSRIRAAGPMGQARNALAQNQGASTSYGAGGQYDGSAPAGIGGAGQSVGGGGAGTPGGSTNPSAPTAAAGGPSQFPPPPTPDGTNVTPWQHALDLAVALIAIASLILMFGKTIANKMGGASPGIIYALAAIVAALGVGVMMLGKTIAGGQFGQTYQGGMFVAAGAALMVGAAAMMYSQATSKPAVEAQPNATPPVAAQPAGIMNGPQASTMQMVMMLSGASAMGLAMMGAMKPMAKYDQSAFPNGVPDLGYYSAPAPLRQYVVLGEAHGSDSRDS